MSNIIRSLKFGNIDLNDSFFDSLKADYPGFGIWFTKKAANDATAYVTSDLSGKIDGFLYLKVEDGVVDDVLPKLQSARRLKIGTFKIDARNTKLGERFIKKVFDVAISEDVDEIYVTVFSKHKGLTTLFKRFGFVHRADKSAGSGDPELVLIRDLNSTVGDLESDYPFIHTMDVQKYLLAIYPEWHTQLFPDSILNNESYDVVKDLSHTNSVHKIYVCWMDVAQLKKGDILVIYRTSDSKISSPAEYQSVATSVCVVEDVKRARSFAIVDDFIKHCAPYSVFTEDQLRSYYKQYNTSVIKMTYNAALSKRLTRHDLIELAGLKRNQRWSFIEITEEQFSKILNLGGVNENLIVD